MKKSHLEKVNVKCLAIIDGQHGGRVVRAGEQFSYKGNLVNGRFPLWVKCLDEEFKSEFSKLSPSEQKLYLNQPAKKEDESSNVDIEKIKADLKAEMEADLRASISEEEKEKIRQEVLAEFSSASLDQSEPDPSQQQFDVGQQSGLEQPNNSIV